MNSLLPVRIASEAVQFTCLRCGTHIRRHGPGHPGNDPHHGHLGLDPAAGPGPCPWTWRRTARAVRGGGPHRLTGPSAAGDNPGKGRKGSGILRRVPLITAFSHSVAERSVTSCGWLHRCWSAWGNGCGLGVCGWIVAQDMGIPLTLPQAVLVVLATIFLRPPRRPYRQASAPSSLR